jgi:hypothetical protein
LYEIACVDWVAFKGHLLRYTRLGRDVRNQFIFRGQRDSDWPLSPTLDRNYPLMSPSEREEKLRALLREFTRELYGLEAEPTLRESERTELLGRHHGLPTTVLDWSRSPYVAAYFAFESEQTSASGRVAIWSFDRRQLSRSRVAGDVLIDDMSLVGDNVRAIQQRGVFLRLPVGMAAEKELSEGLVKYTIPHSERALALSDLDEMLITARALFRDRDAAARTATIRESLP